MNKKNLVFLISIFYSTSVYAEINSKFILNSKIKGKEFISIAVTPLSDKKQIIDLWVTDVNKTGGFSVYDEQDEELKKYNSNSITTIKGLCDRADNILTLKDNRIAIKIDVERHEENVLVGMKKILDQNKILMQIEIFDTRKDRIFSLLKKSGFRLINNIEKDYYFKNF